MEKIKSVLPWPLRIIISFLFIISAIAKMYPSPYFAISTFEVKQLYPLGFSDSIAPYFSRFLIGIELALGILILQNNFLRKIIIPATILLLAVFTTHLTIVTIQDGGNSGNCGCFGSLLPMTPIEAIIKNVVAMALLAYLLYLLPKEANGNRNFWFLCTVTLASILALFMLAPIQPIQPKSNFGLAAEATTETDSMAVENNNTVATTDAVEKTIKKDSVKGGTAQKTEQKTTETAVQNEPAPHKSGYAKFFSKIDTGRKTLCFFVPGCDHCRQAAKELTELKQKNADFPEISIIFMNEEADLIPAFFKEAGAEYPYTIVEVIPFWNLLGPKADTPGVKYLWNGNTYKYYNGITDKKFDPIDYQKLISKPYSELAPKK